MKRDGSKKVIMGLRRQAKVRLRATRRDVAALPVKDVQQLVHELQVHQIELEMQNEELCRARVELEATRDRYVDLYIFSPFAHLRLDRHGTIVDANLMAGTLLGIDRKELIGQPLARFIAAKDSGTFHRHCQEVLKTGTRENCEVQIWEGAGVSRWVYFESLAVHDETGRISDWRTALLDVSDRKWAEEDIRRQRELLEAVNEELESFSYSVSHDLRAPLRSMDGFSQALLEDCAGLLNEQGKDYLNRIRAASQRMGQLIDDLLSLSRTTRDELRYESVDLSGLALGVADELRRIWPGRQVELVVAPGLRAQGDPRLLRIVFDNLLGNAWKFTCKRERAVIDVGTLSHDGTTAYFVRDNGVGFDMAYVDKLFCAFQRLHAITEFPGNGIGLATVRRIVVRHGGRVWAEGRVGQGATVFFTLGERSA